MSYNEEKFMQTTGVLSTAVRVDIPSLSSKLANLSGFVRNNESGYALSSDVDNECGIISTNLKTYIDTFKTTANQTYFQLVGTHSTNDDPITYLQSIYPAELTTTGNVRRVNNGQFVCSGTEWIEIGPDITGKVDKVTDKSLIADSEISKLANYPEYTNVVNDISTASTLVKDDVTNKFNSLQSELKAASGLAIISANSYTYDYTYSQGDIDLKIDTAEKKAYQEAYISAYTDAKSYTDGVIYTKTQIDNKDSIIAVSAYNNTINYVTGYTYSQTEIDSKVASIFKFRGNYDTLSNLSSQIELNPENIKAVIGDVWHITDGPEKGNEYVWDGTSLVNLGMDIDLSPYALSSDVLGSLDTKVDKQDGYSLTKNDFTDAYKGKVDYFESISGSFAKKGTTLSDYGIEDAKISSDIITLGNDSINTTKFALSSDVKTSLNGLEQKAMKYKGQFTTLPNLGDYAFGDVVTIKDENNQQYILISGATYPNLKEWKALGNDKEYCTISEISALSTSIMQTIKKLSGDIFTALEELNNIK